MNPLPAQSSDAPPPPPAAAPPTASYSHSQANRRASTCQVQRIYPWLLFASTAVAALFCLLYITKPVIVTSQGIVPAMTEKVVSAPLAPAATAGLLPSQNRLPGEVKSSASADARPQLPTVAEFEQTNLRVQHILTAEAPGGHQAKINIDVPVLYQSRNLRWTAAEVANARELLGRLADYQEKSRDLRSEGTGLLKAWNQLIARSIPASDLRADSPTLPDNQHITIAGPRPAGLDTSELIQIQPAGK